MPSPLLPVDSAESAAYAATGFAFRIALIDLPWLAPKAIHERGVTESLRRGAGPMKRGWWAPDCFRIEFPAVLPAPTFDPAIAAPVLMQAMPQ